MNDKHAKDWPLLKEMVEDLRQALHGRMSALVLYGSAARGEYHEKTSDLNLVLVATALDPRTLEAMGAPVTRWVKKGQPPPRLFTPAMIAESVDVYPLEFLDIRTHRVLLAGADPFGEIRVRTDQLRLQIERELREKLMRLREGYIVSHGRDRALRQVLGDSLTTFTALFRGCLHLAGATPPAPNAEVAAAFCARAGLYAEPFVAVERLRRRAPGTAALDPKTLFSRYYDELGKAVEAIDRFKPEDGGETR
jgi:hypothetical protein